MEFPPIQFVIDIFNRLCFLQYNDGSGRDVEPQYWKVCTYVIRMYARALFGTVVVRVAMATPLLFDNQTFFLAVFPSLLRAVVFSETQRH